MPNKNVAKPKKVRNILHPITIRIQVQSQAELDLLLELEDKLRQFYYFDTGFKVLAKVREWIFNI